ncbi:free fatty acid receptor 2 [Xenopus laevis]|uniref:Free fatty acid receptor 1 n=2 Tax=Xenopus laevis TaxID=8355 RepID=A0A8J0TA06_XENLA|nr:free fatty acid receptor 2 [Xenopus laevis]
MDMRSKMLVDNLSLAIYVLTIFLGLPSNVIVLYLFFKEARNRLTPNLIYMINLCVSDLVFIMVLPIKITEIFSSTWTLPQILCPLYNLIHYSTIYASVCFLSAVSVGRYLSIAFPIKYNIYKKPRYSCLICVILWAIVIFHMAFVFLVETSKSGSIALFLTNDDNTWLCYENFTSEQLALVVPVRFEISMVLYFFPLGITVFCYMSCIRILMRSRMHVNLKRKATRVAVTTLVVFIVCFAPYNISHVVGYVIHESVWWRKWALLPSTCNAFLDPLIFYFISSSADRGFYHIWKSLQLKYSVSRRRFSSLFSREQQESSRTLGVAAISATV